MADALICDHCGAKLILDGPGRSDADGESASWVRVGFRDGETFDACTRSCATELLGDDGPIAEIESRVMVEGDGG